MKERLAEIGQKLAKNVDRVAVVVFLLLLMVAGFLLFREYSYNPPEPPARPRNEWNIKIPAPPEGAAAPAPPEGEEAIESELSPYQQVQENFPQQAPPVAEDPELRRLVTINMFDAGSVRSQIEQAKIIEQDLERARSAYEAQNYQEALRIVETILRRNPDHKRTQDLKAEIQQAMSPEAANEGAAPSGGTNP